MLYKICLSFIFTLTVRIFNIIRIVITVEKDFSNSSGKTPITQVIDLSMFQPCNNVLGQPDWLIVACFEIAAV